MRGIKWFITGLVVAMLVGLTAAACDVEHNSPELVAKAYVNAASKIDYGEIIECSDYEGEYKKATALNAAEALVNYYISMIPDEAKAELKTYKFKSYEKLDGQIVEETKETQSGEKIVITETETGKITVTYKEDGKGETLERDLIMIFVKVDGKWYLGIESLISL